MPVGIIGKGGQSWKAELALSKDDAINALDKVKLHLSRPGKASGVLTIVNRTKQGAELSLERKNKFQLWGRGEGNQRLNDTRYALTKLFQQAGMDHAISELDKYLSSPDRHSNRVSAKKMLAILEKHLPTAQILNSVANAKNQRNSLFPSDVESVQVTEQKNTSAIEEIPDVDDLMPEIAEANKLRGRSESSVKSNDSSALLPYPVRAKGGNLDELMRNAGISAAQKSNDAPEPIVGKGSFGQVARVTMDGQTRLLKTFHGDETPLLSLERNGGPNEAIAAYLTSKKDPEYAKRVRVVQPEYFLISSGGRFLMVDPLGLRALIKASPANQVKCHALVMKFAEGDEISKISKNLTEAQKKKVFKGTVEAIKVMNQRGFVHRDIKPENAFFDTNSSKLTLIDTGMLHKVSKNNPYSRQLTDYAGSPAFMHPKILTGIPYGTEVDLYAAAMMALDLENPAVFRLIGNEYVAPERALIQAGRYGDKKPQFFNKQMLMELLELRLEKGERRDGKPISTADLEKLEEFKKSLERNDSFASLIVDTLTLATAEPVRRMVRTARRPGAVENPQPVGGIAGVDWTSTQRAQEAYEKLLDDPRFQ